ncbi:hypothetical protein [Nocardia bovistercoris]|uniref:Uncharacterized protein n=1 Tax=Nocardia bovistercoris TaxID=2785916 RepID=A0A931IEE1_9NOCA|nr:hypothetical protein [Nocardia bovistercoris]MBH0778577.1 hypothetical protein [Nocardia bovistercoris]
MLAAVTPAVAVAAADAAPASTVTWIDCENGGGIVILEQNGQYTCIHGFYGDMLSGRGAPARRGARGSAIVPRAGVAGGEVVDHRAAAPSRARQPAPVQAATIGTDKPVTVTTVRTGPVADELAQKP